MPKLALEYNITPQQRQVLYDAMIQYVHFWRAKGYHGLCRVPSARGPKLCFRSVVRDGYMVLSPRAARLYKTARGSQNHYVFTPKGAEIVYWWIDCGYADRNPDALTRVTVAERDLPPLHARVTLAESVRLNKFMENGVPRWVRCYDNGGKTMDRYTAVFSGRYRHLTGGQYLSLMMSARPFHPQGVGQHGEDRLPIDRPKSSHLGRKIKFQDLPSEVQQCVRQTYAHLWTLPTPYAGTG